ncbi:MAG: AmmeMemoRadiSam system radical SAM enzyme [Ignavibacteria bacterium]|nr:AmmeMemoRadiSam system radical SAM enzyme [Ignavibacteria bacterium]
MSDVLTLKDLLTQNTREGELYSTMPDNWVRCVACGHRCKIPPGRDGICRVRFNHDGKLMVPSGYAAGIALDPVEKKPFFHAYPGAKALSFGMLGCDYHCSYCQNWVSSQALRDPIAGSAPEYVTPEQFVSLATKHNARIVTSTYNEPLITSEWAVEIFKLAKQADLITSYVSNGNGTPEVLEYLKPHLDLFKIDLKGFRQKQYAQLGGVLQNVLDTIMQAYQMGFWVEIVTLVVPGFNDSEEEMRDIARFIRSVSPDIPWHVTGFHRDYHMMEPENTPSETLIRAVEIGYDVGLHYVYGGNRPGEIGSYENTYCPSCETTLVERWGFRVLSNQIRDGACSHCGTTIAGRWQ